MLAILDSRMKIVAHERFQYVLLKKFGERKERTLLYRNKQSLPHSLLNHPGLGNNIKVLVLLKSLRLIFLDVPQFLYLLSLMGIALTLTLLRQLLNSN